MKEQFRKDDMPRIMALVAGFFASAEPDKDYIIEMRAYRKKRSLDANAYYWKLAGEIAEKTGVSVEAVYRAHIRDIGGNYEMLCVMEKAVDEFCRVWESRGIGWIAEQMPSKIPKCVTVRAFYGSSTYDAQQMSRLIDLAIQDCKTFGIEYLTPTELAKMMQEWGESDGKGE